MQDTIEIRLPGTMPDVAIICVVHNYEPQYSYAQIEGNVMEFEPLICDDVHHEWAVAEFYDASTTWLHANYPQNYIDAWYADARKYYGLSDARKRHRH